MDIGESLAQDVIDRLRTKGWMKEYFGERYGPNCLAGAIGFSAADILDNNGLMDAVSCKVKDAYPDRTPLGRPGIPSFNDHPRYHFG